MSIELYRIFLKTVEYGNFHRTAKALGITPSAISYSIARLEEKLGGPLLQRSKKGVRITRRGDELLPYIRNVLLAEKELENMVSEQRLLEESVVRIAAFNSVCMLWLPGIIKSFELTHPSVRVEVFQGLYNEVLEQVESGAAQIGFLPSTTTGNVDMMLVNRDRIMCVTPPDFSPKQQDYVTIDDLRGHEFIYRRDDYDEEIHMIIREYQLDTNPQFNIMDVRTLIAMVEYGFGFSLLPEMLLNCSMHKASVYPLVPNEYRLIGLATSPQFELTDIAQEMLDHILNYLSKEGFMNVK